jgi:hypothetical protein
VIVNLDLGELAGARTVVLVEGMSDQAAIEELARRRGLSLRAEGISVLPMGGATNIGHYLEALGPHGLDVRLAGLCDTGEEGYFRHAIEHAGFGAAMSREQMEELGFGVCVADLEDELIRALGTAVVEDVIAAEGEIGSFRTFAKQPFQRERSSHQQLHRFMGTRSGRKTHYARLLTSALDLDRVPRPLDLVVYHLERASRA